MANSWKNFESCVDMNRPSTQKGDKSSYELRLANNNLESRKIDADKVKAERRLTEKIADAYFFIWEKHQPMNESREKVLIVETKGKAFGHALEQLESCHKMLSYLNIEMHGRIVGSNIPAAIRTNRDYLRLQKLYKGRVKTKSIKMIETFTSFEKSSIQ